MKKVFLFLVFFKMATVFGQDVQFIEKENILDRPKYQQFVYLMEQTSIAKCKFVGRVKATGASQNVVALFDAIKRETQPLGANSFKFLSFKWFDANVSELILDVFYSDDSTLQDNISYIPLNKVYIFGSPDFSVTSNQSFKVNSDKYKVDNGKYRVFDVEVGQVCKISKGGFTGMSLWVDGEKGKLSTFLSFNGIGVNTSGLNPRGGGGIAINTGKINHVEQNLALALLKIYTLQE